MNLGQIILNMKIWQLIATVGGLLIAGSLIKNIFTGSFNVFKFVNGFNPFLGGIQGKLIWLAVWCFIFFTAYQFIMRPTYNYDTNYRNQIHDNQDVAIDQRIGATCIPTKILWGLIQIGCNSKTIEKQINYSCENCKEIKK